MKHIRNFCIIAHIDHGKSTLADRLLEITKTIPERKMRSQYLDQMDLEREKGITIKLQPVTISYSHNNIDYTLNLIDTPGHVDFSYEVSRSLACVEGAILLIDSTQGIQAQTLSTLYEALEQDIEIIPVINKIDLPNSDPDKTKNEIHSLLGYKNSEILEISGKTGQGVNTLLKEIINRIPPPKLNKNEESKSLIFDSTYDPYTGVIAYVRVFNGQIKTNNQYLFFNSNKKVNIIETGIFKPDRTKTNSLDAGSIGYIITGLKDVGSCQVGDTLTDIKNPSALPGYKKMKPVAFASIYPVNSDDFPALRDALSKLQLNDSSISFKAESSKAFGKGYRCGFLGLLHLEIVKERLEREYDLDLVITSPSVKYQIITNENKTIFINNPQELPDPSQYKEIREPWADIEIITPAKFLGKILEFMPGERAIQSTTDYLDKTRLILDFKIPLQKLVSDFYDNLKSITEGYASLNYRITNNYLSADLVKLEILINNEVEESLSRIMPRSEIEKTGRKIISKLKNLIPRQNFAIPLQASVGGNIVARETIKAFRKDVTSKLYGGDITRKMKLLKKQKKGKKKMEGMGKIKIPKEALFEILKT